MTMSTSVCKRKPFTLLSKMRDTFSMGDCRRGPGGHTSGNILKVKRVLFETPDHDATLRFLEDELSAQYCTESIKWNFDFINEKTLDPDGPYVWMPVSPHPRTSPLKRQSCKNVNDNVAQSVTNQLYFDPSNNVLRQSTSSSATTAASPSNTLEYSKHHQSLITDYMTAKKRTSEFLIKSSSERALKVRRLNDCSS